MPEIRRTPQHGSPGKRDPGVNLLQYDYTDPVARLLNYGGLGDRRIDERWPNYLELGFTDEHVPDLIRMTNDNDLNTAKQDSPEVWAPLHAWRTLGQLRSVEAIRPLVRLFESLPGDDWLASDLRTVFSLIGPASIPALTEFLGDSAVGESSRIAVPECLERIALDHPDHRDECVGVLERQLAHYETNGPALNAFLILSLTNLEATAAIDNIRKAFAADCVDLSVQGDVEDVEIEMGLRMTRDTPSPEMSWIPGFPNLGADDGWSFVSDDFRTDPQTNPFRHVGRNDPCPCGSGKKYKKCCLQ